MSDTSKCPACGKPITWANIEPDLGMCYSCGFQTPVCGKPMVPEMARVAALHRIRELEARVQAKDAALSLIVDGATQIAREALKK